MSKNRFSKVSPQKRVMTPLTESKQKESETFEDLKQSISPDISFHLLRKAVRTSSLLSGIIKKIASSADTGFIETGHADLDSLLINLDTYDAIFNICTYGNVFFEVLRNQGGKILNLDKILTETVTLKKGDEDYIQLIQNVGKAGVNPIWEPGEYIHIKLSSLTNKRYGDTIFIDCIESVLILFFIERVYKKLFENGLIEPSILVDEESILTDEDKNSIVTFIKDYFSGADNGFELGIISGKLKKLELTNKLDHNSFIALKREIKEDIAIALQCPVDLITGKNSNRATRESSFEDFNLTTIKPIQTRFVRQLREGLRPYFGDKVDLIEMHPVDTKNEAEMAKTVETLISCGVFTIDMGLEYLGYDATGIAANQVHEYRKRGSDTSISPEDTQDQLEKVYSQKEGGWKGFIKKLVKHG